MQRFANGSVLLSQEEASVVAKVLDLGRSLCEDMGVCTYDNQEHHLEVQLSETIDFLEELGVSSDELVGKLEERPRTG